MFGILLALTVPAFDGDRANAGPEELVRQLSDEKFDTRQQAHDGIDDSAVGQEMLAKTLAGNMPHCGGSRRSTKARPRTPCAHCR